MTEITTENTENKEISKERDAVDNAAAVVSDGAPPLVSNSILFNKVGVDSAAAERSEAASKIVFDYKNIGLLMQYVAEGWRILPRRVTKLSKKQQKQLKRSIKRARQLMLIPYKPVIEI